MRDKLELAPINVWKYNFEADDEGNIYYLLIDGSRGDKIKYVKQSIGSPNGVLQYYYKCHFYINNKITWFTVHRVLWLLWYEEIPNIIDHINGIKHDNRKINLRNVTQFENAQNITKGPRAVRKMIVENVHKSYAK